MGKSRSQAKGELGSFTRYWIHLIIDGEAGRVTVVVQESWMVSKQSDPNGILCKSRNLERILSQQHCCLNVEIMYIAIFIHQNAAGKQSYLSVAQVSIENVSEFSFQFLSLCILNVEMTVKYFAFWMQSWLCDVCMMGKLFRECGFAIIFN